MRRFSAVRGAVVGVLLLAGLAGCSPSRGSAAATTTTQQDVAALWHELVRCAREHGMPNLPEPQIDSEGQPHWPGGVEPPEPPPSVEQACHSIVERFPASVRGAPATTPADSAKLLRFARCMREHEITDFPDPKAAAEHRHGLGLGLMRERVTELGGTFWLDSTPGKGTSVRIQLPRGRR
jgi:hypothetical protein